MSADESAQSLVRPMTTSDLALVLDWRNHDDVRKNMFTRHIISSEEHAQWFETTSREESRHLLVFELDGIPTGFVNLHETAPGRIADWGFFTSPHAPAGTGRRLGAKTLLHAFQTLRLHKICGRVLAYNDRSVRFHLALGFRQEGVQREQHFDGREYHDVVCFGLLASEWASGPES